MNETVVERPKRQVIADPRSHLDSQIGYLIGVLPFYVDQAKEEIEKKQKKLVFIKMSWGWSILVAGLLDFYSNFLLNNRTLGNFGTVGNYWGYGMTGFYALGFGFPYLLDLPEDHLKCGASNFLETLNQYKLANGLEDLFQTNLPISDIRTIVAEFNSWVRIQVGCVSNFEGDLVEVAEVGYLLDELNAAMNIRLDLEDVARKEKVTMDNDVTSDIPKDETSQSNEKLPDFTNTIDMNDLGEENLQKVAEISNNLIDLNEIVNVREDEVISSKDNLFH